jgi:hypothetical protein
MTENVMESCDLTFHREVGNGPTRCGALAIGHSHLTAVHHAYKQRKAGPEGASSIQFHFLQLLNEEFRPSVITTEGDARINELLEAAISEGIYGLPQKKVVALFLSGNEYHFIGMFNQPRRYDFLLPERPDLPFTPDAEVIPTALIEEKLRRQIRAATQLAPLIKTLVGADVPVYALESPPPIPDSHYISNGKSIFSDDVEKFGVSPASLRYKLWLLQSRLFKQCLNDAGVMYLRRPATVVDEAGFMLPSGWHPDGVHGSAWFGDSLLKQIEDLFVIPAAHGDQT